MAEKIFTNVRLGLKVDTLENWGKSALVLKKGEVAFATVAATAGTGLTEPVCMMKIGDGEHVFKDLDWNFYAKASDVLASAKSEDALRTFINNVIAGAGIATNEALTNLTTRVTTAEGKVTTLEGTVGNAEGGLVKDVATNATDIAALEGLVGDKKVATQISDAIAALNLSTTYEEKGEAAKVQTALDTYKTSNDKAVADNKAAIESEAATARAAEKVNADAITAIKDGTTIDSFADVETALAGKQATGDYATKAEAQGYANAKDAAIEAAAAAAAAAQADADALEGLVGGTKVSDQISTAITNLDLDNTYAAKSHTHTKAEITDFDHTHEIADVTGLQAALDGKQAAGDYATKTEAKGYADAKDEAIAAAQAAADKAQGEVDALETYVGTIPSDEKYADITNVVAYVNKKAEETLTSATGGSSESAASVLAALNTYKSENDPKVTANTEAIADLEELVGDTKVSTAIENAVKTEKERAEAAEKANSDAITTLTNGAVKANTDAIAKLNGNANTEGSVDYKVAQEVAKILNDNDATDIDTLEEIAAWIKNDTAGVGDLNRRVTENATAITKLNGDASTEGSVDKKIADAIIAENLGQYATDGELSALAGRVSTVEGDLNTETTGLKARMTIAEADIIALETKVGDKAVSEQITDVTNPLAKRVEDLEAIDHDHTNKTVLDGIEATDVTAWDAKVDNVTAAADSGLKATRTENTVAIEIDDSVTFIFDCGGADVAAE